MTRRMFAVLISAMAALAIAGSAFAQCAYTISAQNANQSTSTINYIPIGNEPFGNTLEAIDVWAFGCSGSGSSSNGYPSLNVGPYDNTPGTMNVYVRYLTGYSTSPDGRCGVTDVYVDPASCAITGAMVTMWQFDASGNHCEDTMVDLVAHEIGHTLGLGDVDGIAACNGTIMGSNPSYVSPEQCNMVENNWYTPEEYDEDHINDSCTAECRGTCYEGHCDASECFQYPDGSYSSNCYSPILIDLGGHGYHLTSAENGVVFDLDADGAPDITAWTRDGANAFLCLDRNHNGKIDDGSELFGNHTPLSTGAIAPNGYEALAEFDRSELGGNGDGIVDARDAIWPALRVWSDTNHDGISQANELRSLAEANVLRIDTRYYLARRRDSFGNQFRFRGRCLITAPNGVAHDHMTYDVFFITEGVHAP